MKKSIYIALTLILSGVSLAFAQKGQRINVLSLNVNACRPVAKISTPVFEAIAKVIKESGADIVALQELDVNTSRSGNTNQPHEIAKLCGMNYYFAKAIDLQGGEYGLAILSKYSIQETFRIELPNSQKEARIVVAVRLQLPDKKELIVLNTNLDIPAPNAVSQAEGIIEIAGGTKLPVILAGDFNHVPGSAPITVLDLYFTRTCRTIKCAPTFPVLAPTKTISHIMYRSSDKFRSVSHKVIDEISGHVSDQRPVFAEIELSVN